MKHSMGDHKGITLAEDYVFQKQLAELCCKHKVRMVAFYQNRSDDLMMTAAGCAGRQVASIVRQVDTVLPKLKRNLGTLLSEGDNWHTL